MQLSNISFESTCLQFLLRMAADVMSFRNLLTTFMCRIIETDQIHFSISSFDHVHSHIVKIMTLLGSLLCAPFNCTEKFNHWIRLGIASG